MTNREIFESFKKKSEKILKIFGIISLSFAIAAIVAIPFYAIFKNLATLIVLTSMIGMFLGFAFSYLVAKSFLKKRSKYIEIDYKELNISAFVVSTTGSQMRDDVYLSICVDGKEKKTAIVGKATLGHYGGKYGVLASLIDIPTYLQEKTRDKKSGNNIVELKTKARDIEIVLLYDKYKRELGLVLDNKLIEKR